MSREDTVEEVNGIRIHYVREGKGPLVVMLHGWPQHSYCFRRVMPLLAQHCTVVTPDMRGYGLTDKPTDGYDKKTMAADIRALTKALGYEKVSLLVGHDRGARVAHRYALDYADEVERLCMLDIIPTREVLRTQSQVDAKRYWHWLFHLHPDLAELFIRPNIEAYIRYFFRYAYVRPALEEGVAEYVKCLEAPGTLRATFEDYRLTFSKDLEDDDADHAAGNKLKMPTMILWGEKGPNAKTPMMDVWKEYANDVRGKGVERCGYYMPEEQPGPLAEHLLSFLREPAKR
jgi:haloacetate dehalogenase